MKDDVVPPSVRDEITAPPGEEANMQIAFAAVQAARRETFLAHYPRNLKLGVTALFFFLVSMPFWGRGAVPTPHEETPSIEGLLSEKLPTGHERGGAPEKRARTESHFVEKVEFKTETEKSAAAFNDSTEATQRMAVAPDFGLVEESPQGRLPKVSLDGRKPWQVYARPFDQRDPRPRIAIVIGDLGFSRVATDAVLRRMPPNVTLAFDVQGGALEGWLQRARQDGHETLLSIPMEPFDYPRSDPGPNALLTSLPNADNIQRITGFLRLGTGYVGVTTLSGSRFSADTNKLSPIIDVLRERGLMVMDTKVATHSVVGSLAKEKGVPLATSTRVIDASPTPQSIDEALSDLEQTARVEGYVVGLASPLPVSIDRIEAWSKGLSERGVVLAPITAVAQ